MDSREIKQLIELYAWSNPGVTLTCRVEGQDIISIEGEESSLIVTELGEAKDSILKVTVAKQGVPLMLLGSDNAIEQ